jgi:lysozyme
MIYIIISEILDKDPKMIDGIDVSDVQGVIDWSKVKNSNVEFAFCKATENTKFVAKRFLTNWTNIKKAKLIRGAYHFARLSNDPIQEATHFIETIPELFETDMLVLDIEDDKTKLSNSEFINWTLSFLDYVENKTQITPIVYTGGPYFDFNSGSPSDDIINKLNHYPLWLAAYTLTPNKYIPYVWKNVGWKIWQRSGDVAAKGDKVFRVPGINNVVDRNQFDGTVEDLRDFAISLHTTLVDPIIQPLSVDLDLTGNMPVAKNEYETLKSPKFGDLIMKFFKNICQK